MKKSLFSTTEYVGLDEGTDDRLDLYIVYFF